MSGRAETQKRLIAERLMQKGSITAMEALECCGSMRLAARISDLKDDGYDIWTERVSVLDERGKETSHYAKYHLRGIRMTPEEEEAYERETDAIVREDRWNECRRDALYEEYTRLRDEIPFER